MKTILSAIAIATLLTLSASAQDAESDFQAWNALAVSGSLKEDSRFLVWFDGHARFRDDASDLGVSIIRPGIGWRVQKGLDAWIGYARVVSRDDDRPDIKENRIWQQATYSLPTLLNGNLSGRSRLEQRFRETGDDTGWRYRQFVRWSKPIGDSDFSAVLWDELFLNLNNTDWGQRGGFDQNRFFVGAAWHVNRGVRLEGGYLNNVLDRAVGDAQVNHNFSISLFLSL